MEGQSQGASWSVENWGLAMITKIGLWRAGGLWLALVAVLGLSVMVSAMPVAAQQRVGTPGLPGAHSTQIGAPNRDTNFHNWPRPTQQFSNLQPCGISPYSQSYDLFSASALPGQPCAFPCPSSAMQEMIGDPDLTSWYGYNRYEVAWWPYSNSSLGLALGSCGGFQGWWTP